MKSWWKSVLAALALLAGGWQTLWAGDIQGRIDSLRRSYDFPAAVRACLDSLESVTDSLERIELEDLLALCKNGQSMMEYCVMPSVVARQGFSADEFLLFYPVENHSWLSCPNGLDSLGGDIWSRGVFYRDEDSRIIYSAQDSEGVRNICQTSRKGDGWSVSTAFAQVINSPEDEIYPMLSEDGRSLYFASRGHYGMGGFDLYVSNWNDADSTWSAPVNLGFPYSSPYDDFLYYNTPDGRYTIFASNRDCAGTDSVYLYVLEFEPLPVHQRVSDPKELADLAALPLKDNIFKIDNSSAIDNTIIDNPQTDRYVRKVAEVRSLRDEIAQTRSLLDEMLERYNVLPSPELKDEIMEKEMIIPTIQTALDKAIKELQAIEMEFLLSGVVIDIDKVREDSRKEVIGASSGFAFTRLEYHPSDPSIKPARPVPPMIPVDQIPQDPAWDADLYLDPALNLNLVMDMEQEVIEILDPVQIPVTPPAQDSVQVRVPVPAQDSVRVQAPAQVQVEVQVRVPVPVPAPAQEDPEQSPSQS